MAVEVLWCDDWARIGPRDGKVLDEGDGAPAEPPIRLAGLRGGYACCQLAVGPIARGAPVKVLGGELAGPGRGRLTASLWDPFVQWYHRIGNGWYPDALLPQEAVGGSTPALRRRNRVGGQRFAGFWLDLFIPRDARPGKYTGELAVKVGRDTLPVPVEVEVAKARVPREGTIEVSLNNYADAISRGWPGLADNPRRFWTERYRRIERGVFRCAHEHGAFLHYLPYGHSGYVYGDFAPPLAGEGEGRRVADWSDFDRHFGPYFDGSAFAGTRRGAVPVARFWTPLNLCWPADFLKFATPGYAAEWRAVGRQMVEHFRRKGWTKTSFDLFLNHKQRFRFFPWDCEEARFLPDQDIHRHFRAIWEGTFDWPSAKPVRFSYTLGTTWTYHLDIRSDLAEFIDLFIAGTEGPAWFGRETPRLHRRGSRVWSCTRTGDIDQPARATAYAALMAWMRDLDGFMPCWCTMGGWGGDPWHDVPQKGGITLLYPGAAFGSEETFPSQRLKVLRNAMQLVEALRASADGKGAHAALKRRVNRLLGVTSGDWFPPPPDYVTRKLPEEWTEADFATEERPPVDWQRFSADQWRRLEGLARAPARARG